MPTTSTGSRSRRRSCTGASARPTSVTRSGRSPSSRRPGSTTIPRKIRELLWTEDGRRAVEIVLRRIKQQAIAENVMEIITCGAVAPYQQVLGGKLVAMLMTSPQVVSDVKRRYSGKVSLIASGMAGRPMQRKPALSVLDNVQPLCRRKRANTTGCASRGSVEQRR